LTRELSSFEGTTRIVKVPESQLALTSDETKKRLETINTELENLATSVDGEVITVDDNLGDGTEALSPLFRAHVWKSP